MDAGFGLMCLGTGKGGFKTLAHFQSGIQLTGEQRGAASGDWNQDGRLDLLVGQNNGVSHLFNNQAAEPGVMVRLKGANKNPWALGAQIRLLGDKGIHGPWQVIQTGAACGSQNGMLQILGSVRGANHIEVAWPDGRRSLHQIDRNRSTQTISIE